MSSGPQAEKLKTKIINDVAAKIRKGLSGGRADLAERFVVEVPEVVRREGRNLFVEAELLDDAGEVATTASARWVYLG